MDLTEHIRQRELALLHTDLTANPALIDELLAVDFEEIGNDGRVNSRNDVIHWLLHKDRHTQWILANFRIKILTADWVLAHYTALKCNDADAARTGSVRTSIWQRQENHWKMVFHQASKTS